MSSAFPGGRLSGDSNSKSSFKRRVSWNLNVFFYDSHGDLHYRLNTILSYQTQEVKSNSFEIILKLGAVVHVMAGVAHL
jgi:hypothetical protein